MQPVDFVCEKPKTLLAHLFRVLFNDFKAVPQGRKGRGLKKDFSSYYSSILCLVYISNSSPFPKMAFEAFFTIHLNPCAVNSLNPGEDALYKLLTLCKASHQASRRETPEKLFKLIHTRYKA